MTKQKLYELAIDGAMAHYNDVAQWDEDMIEVADKLGRPQSEVLEHYENQVRYLQAQRMHMVIIESIDNPANTYSLYGHTIRRGVITADEDYQEYLESDIGRTLNPIPFRMSDLGLLDG